MRHVLFTTELSCVHPKLLAILYSALVILSLAVGYALSITLRANLITPVYQDESYYSAVSLHGLFMIFLYLMPILYGVYGNYLTAQLMSASDMLFPRFNIYALQVLGASVLFMGLTGYIA